MNDETLGTAALAITTLLQTDLQHTVRSENEFQALEMFVHFSYRYDCPRGVSPSGANYLH
jgi:hypothetical protein